MIELSIIIVNFNTKDFIKQCIASIIGSSFEREFEIIVVDNASTDGSVEDIQKTTSLTQNFFLIENKENVGFSKANNQGIGVAKGSYFLFLNPDTVFSTDTLETVISFMEKHPDVGVATARINLPNGTLDEACHRGFPTPWNAFCYFSSLSKLCPKSKLFAGYQMGWLDLSTTHEVESVCGAFMMVSRQAGDQIGWWDEDYFWYGEDIDFCYRIKQKGLKIYYIPSASITHYKGVSGGIKQISKNIATASETIKRNSMIARFEAMRIFYKKHYKKRYPWFLTRLVFGAIGILRFFNLYTLRK